MCVQTVQVMDVHAKFTLIQVHARNSMGRPWCCKEKEMRKKPCGTPEYDVARGFNDPIEGCAVSCIRYGRHMAEQCASTKVCCIELGRKCNFRCHNVKRIRF